MYRRYRKRYQSQATWQIFILVLGLGVLGVTIFPFLQDDIISVIPILIVFGVLLILGILPILWYFRQKEKARLRALTISHIDHMTGEEFERYVGELLKHQGYKTQFTATSGDYGVDIIARKGNAHIAVQVKRHAYSIGQEAIREAVAGMKKYSCTTSMVVTTNYFTHHARDLAKSNDCVLVDREKLGEWIVAFQKST